MIEIFTPTDLDAIVLKQQGDVVVKVRRRWWVNVYCQGSKGTEQSDDAYDCAKGYKLICCVFFHG